MENINNESLTFNVNPVTKQYVSPSVLTKVLEKFDYTLGDGGRWEEFLVDLGTYDTWLHSSTVNSIYSYYHLYMHTDFRKVEAPKRCLGSLKYYIEVLYKHFKETSERVNKSLLKTTLRFLIKHISRLAYHGYYGLVYSRHDSYYKDNPHVSHSYLLRIIDYFVSERKIVSFSGYVKSNGDNIRSLIIVSKDFINECVGRTPLGNMEEALQRSRNNLYVLRERVYDDSGKCKKMERCLKHGEKKVVNSIEEAMLRFDNHLDNYVIRINGVLIVFL